jgi:hypothetical protein
VVIPDSAIPGQQVIRLSGQAVAPAVTLTPPSLAFGQPGDAVAPSQAVVLRNGGDGPLHVTSIDIQPANSNFFQTNNCPGTLARGDSCTISVNFKQISAGTPSQAATLVVQDDAAGNPNSLAGAGTRQIVPLTGAFASAVALLNPAGLSFSQNMGGASPPQVIRLVNSGDAPMAISGIRTDGDFAESNACPAVLAPKASCPISLSFQPTTTGERDGYIVVADGAPDSPQKISLVGELEHVPADLRPECGVDQRAAAAGPAKHGRRTVDHRQHRRHRRLRCKGSVSRRPGSRCELRDCGHLHADYNRVAGRQRGHHGRCRQSAGQSADHPGEWHRPPAGGELHPDSPAAERQRACGRTGHHCRPDQHR